MEQKINQSALTLFNQAGVFEMDFQSYDPNKKALIQGILNQMLR